MSTQVLDTLRAIGNGLGLNPNTLSVIFARCDEAGEDRPQPSQYVGPNKGIALYDVLEVEAWYLARHIANPRTRGQDKTPRKTTTSPQPPPKASDADRSAYLRGWRSGANATGNNALDNADARREPKAWYAGYYDAATGREKWHRLYCEAESHDACPDVASK